MKKSASDVAAYLLRKLPRIGEKKLQKLLFYAQAWSLVWQRRPLFREHFEAWAEGPVTPGVYGELHHDGEVNGHPSRLTAEEKRLVDTVIRTYGIRSGEWLSRLTHRERPWREARGGLPEGAPSKARISVSSMRSYYATFRTRPNRFDRPFIRGLEALVEMPVEEVELLAAPPTDAGELLAWLEQGEA